MADLEELRMYSDFKSPYAWLGFDPVFALEDKFNVKVRWMPFQLRIKGSGQRSVYSEFKVKYSYMDARRSANERGDKKMIRGPLKIYDTVPALVGGLFAEKHGRLVEYGRAVFEAFFKRELAIDEADAMAAFIENMGMSGDDFRRFLEGDGKVEYDRAQEMAMEDQIFGVPICVLRGEQFWGNDRVSMLEGRLRSLGLGKDATAHAA